MYQISELNYAQIRAKLLAREEIAIVDLREEHIYAQAHPLFSTNISLSRLEVEILNRIPRLDTTIVLYDDADGRVERAYQKLLRYGYRQVHVLKGGIQAWARDGGELFIDVNSATKAFGEWVEYYKHTPSLSAEEVQEKIDANENIVILDARRFDEYNIMSIPSGRSVPGAELVYRAPNLVKDENTTIIVNCAGRTRSIIGTQSLLNAKIPHPVYALRNGTIGWTLAGQSLEHAQTRSFKDVQTELKPELLENAKVLAEKAHVRTISFEELQKLQAETQRTTYIFDVRDEDEYIQGHLEGSRWVAGGQLIQETDHNAAVCGVRIVLIDDQLIRAYMTASWLGQMNWEIYVLETDFSEILTTRGTWIPSLPIVDTVELISPEQLQELKSTQNIAIWDVQPFALYKKAHIPDAAWLLKAEAVERIQQAEFQAKDAVVLTCGRSVLAHYAAEEIKAFHKKVYVLDGGNVAWEQAGYPLTVDNVQALSPQIDRYKRPYEGTDNSHEAMQAYLDWEFGLVDQLKKDGTHGFFTI
ncbi:rhodanese-like domain-containing protein [Acinetobacter schindleri]|uniref:rhodanese-like domain-containing protein n=1 Tax=Acinetobacter schindleri TaxID=108981 RepID=UPI002DBBCA7E|nr:rhodanese-like domain-containing protein [Acinetobacter schindleri]MEB5930252.1 rhodanese-related sulfurtransferase [Acinetobacter schindleri]